VKGTAVFFSVAGDGFQFVFFSKNSFFQIGIIDKYLFANNRSTKFDPQINA
jgi:hypothetical protein